MATLHSKLDEIRAAFASKVPDDVKAIMHRATQDLVDGGRVELALSTGSPMPSFSARTHDGRTVASADLLGPGPLIITFFRGHW